MNFTTVRFFFEEAEGRRVLYENFEMREPTFQGKPIYMGNCRRCGRIVLTVPRGTGTIEGRPIVEALDHLRAHEPR